MFGIFRILDRKNQNLVCQDEMKSLFNEMVHVEGIGSEKMPYTKKKFPDREQFNWNLFYLKMFGLDPFEKEAKFDRDFSKALIKNAGHIHLSMYYKLFEGRYSLILSFFSVDYLKRKLRDPNDKAIFYGEK